MGRFAGEPEGIPDIAPHIARQAVEWLVELQSGRADAATRDDLARWLAQHPDHVRAWRHIEQVNRRLTGLTAPTSSAPVHAVLGAELQAVAVKNGNRRRALKMLLVAAAGAAGLAYQLDVFDFSGDERTGVGERRGVTLADGTRLQLNTDTRVRIRYDNAERRIELLHGEIMVTTAPDQATPPRPLLVLTRDGTVQPLGTVFSVRSDGAASRVDVYRDRVRLLPRDAPQRQMTLSAGQEANFTRSEVSTPAPIDALADAWVDGMIVAANMRLDLFLAELGRYRKGRLSCDPVLADLRVSGAYPLDDTDRVLDALAVSLPLQVRRFSRYWVTLAPRNAPDKK